MCQMFPVASCNISQMLHLPCCLPIDLAIAGSFALLELLNRHGQQYLISLLASRFCDVKINILDY